MEDWEVLITVWKNGRVQETLRFDHSPVTFGASSENDVVLSDREVSSFHGRVTVSRERLAYRDFSTNGSFVAGRRVAEAVLEPEDRLEIPPFEIRTLLLRIPGSRRTFLRPVSDLIATIDPTEEELEPVELGLLIVKGPSDREGSWLEVPAGPQCVGRSEGADLRFDLPTLSRLHAVVQHEGDDVFTIQDLSSSNGVFVNGRKTPVADLAVGDEIRLGSELILQLQTRSNGLVGSRREVEPRASEGVEEHDLEVRVRELDREQGAMQVFELAGRMTGDHAAQSLTLHLDRAVEMSRPLVAIGLAELEEIDGMGLTTLAKAIDALEHLGGDLRLFAARGAVKEAVARSRLKVFFKGRLDVDEEAAIACLSEKSRHGS